MQFNSAQPQNSKSFNIQSCDNPDPIIEPNENGNQPTCNELYELLNNQQCSHEEQEQDHEHEQEQIYNEDDTIHFLV